MDRYGSGGVTLMRDKGRGIEPTLLDGRVFRKAGRDEG